MRALLSVSDKTDLVPFALALAKRDWQIVSTGGTHTTLKEAKVHGLLSVQDLGCLEILDGRVKTLDPKIHGGILARRDKPDHMATIASNGIAPIGLVVVNLYPFAKTAADPAKKFDDLVEDIDIGGPALLRAAAKNFRDVLVVVDSSDYQAVLDQLALPDGPTLEFRFQLAKKAFAHTADYDAIITSTLSDVKLENGEFARERPQFPTILIRKSRKVCDLRYGENPHQNAAWYSDGSSGFGNAKVHQGKELSFTNLLDLDAAARIVSEFDEPAATVVKHTNPCGVATAPDLARAYRMSRDTDSLSAFGGIVGLNKTLDVATAEIIVETFIECLVAPAVEPEALAVLATKPNLRVVSLSFADFEYGVDTRSIVGGRLVQDRDFVSEGRCPWPTAGLTVVTKRQPTVREWQELQFAWRVCAHVKSNAVLLARMDLVTQPDLRDTKVIYTYGIGGGRPNRVDSARIAGGDLLFRPRRGQACVAASDAFFPFRDGLDAVAEAGTTAVVQPGGSRNDAEVIAAADERGMAMVFTGYRHFAH